ncbi:putative phosphopantetheinyl transferase PfaE [Actinacidiphila reveromycinica]|uniref:Putative phosphopantetheinyl transferase PfaE n=1 Tax=Actinacidiphila reveromycinica TaxID=659352 RepID=A0A7U3VQX5_9ACTN|nr:4'-phosphopantetheinyl transferase superfamily protein [Streptomyces sp. SN-593]BBB00139.1 putative phosphopantetheinyl transferase PfaE [Streptomyces sp. SN-593]
MTPQTTRPTCPTRRPRPGAAPAPDADVPRIRLWLLPERAVPRFAAEVGGLRLLTAEERARHARLPTAGARRRYLGARLLSRHALSADTGLPPERWRFRRGPFGRPEPEPAADGVRFNLSHTDGLIACVVTRDRACGVDVERAPASPEAVGHLARRFSAAERAELAALEPAPRQARFSELWVLKESYLKALGTGLTRDLASFSFAGPHPGPGRPAARPDRTAGADPALDPDPAGTADPDPDPVRTPDPARDRGTALAPVTVRPAGRITVDDPERAPGECDRWRFDLLHPGPDHVLAVAAADGRPAALHCTVLPDLPAGL